MRNVLPTGFSFGQYCRAMVSLITTTGRAVSDDSKLRPATMGIFSTLRYSGDTSTYKRAVACAGV